MEIISPCSTATKFLFLVLSVRTQKLYYFIVLRTDFYSRVLKRRVLQRVNETPYALFLWCNFFTINSNQEFNTPVKVLLKRKIKLAILHWKRFINLRLTLIVHKNAYFPSKVVVIGAKSQVGKCVKKRNIEPAKFSAEDHASDVTWLTSKQRRSLSSLSSFH